MSLETPSDTTSSQNSDDLSEEIFYYLEDEQFRPATPLPTFDSPLAEAGFVSPLANRVPPFLLTPPQDSPRRPDTSNSSIFSFDTEPVGTLISSERLRLPTFIVPENPGFFDSQNASETNLYTQFHNWIQDCAPSNGSFEAAAAEEAEKNPRETLSEPDLPSLFKRRDYVRILPIDRIPKMGDTYTQEMRSAKSLGSMQNLRSQWRNESYRDILSDETARLTPTHQEIPRIIENWRLQ